MSTPAKSVTTEDAMGHLGERVSEVPRDSEEELIPLSFEVAFFPGSKDEPPVLRSIEVDSYGISEGTPPLLEFVRKGEVVMVIPSEMFIYAIIKGGGFQNNQSEDAVDK